MMKKIIRISFIAVILIFDVFVFFGMYNSQVSTNLGKVLNAAIDTYDETGDMADLAKCFGIWQNPTDGTPVATAKGADGKSALGVYAQENQYTATFTVEGADSETKIDKLENVYIFMIVHPTFQRLDKSDKTNGCGLKMMTDEGESYTYLFAQSASVNAESYKATLTSEKEANFYEERTITTSYIDNNFDLMFFIMPQSTMNFIVADKLNGHAVTSLNILDTNGDKVYANDVKARNNEKFDYTQAFFNDMSDFLAKVNIYNEYANTKNAELKEQALVIDEYVGKYLDNPDSVITNFTANGYVMGIKRNQVFTGAPMIFTCIGFCTLFLIAGALFYILFFHFDLIRKLGLAISQLGKGNQSTPQNKGTAKKTSTKNNTSQAPKKKESVNIPLMTEAKVVDAEVIEKTSIEDAPVEPIVDDAKGVEEAPAEIVAEAPEKISE